MIKPRISKPPQGDVFVLLVEALAGVRLVKEYRFHDTRRWRFDYAYPQGKIAVEVEGGIWTKGRHVRGKGYLGDMEKYTEASINGWVVIRTTPQELCTMKVVEKIKSVLLKKNL